MFRAYEIILLLAVCSEQFELCLRLSINLLKMDHLTNGDQWKAHATTETDVFDRICMFHPDRRRE